MQKLFEIFKVLQFQKRIVAAATIWGNTVYGTVARQLRSLKRIWWLSFSRYKWTKLNIGESMDLESGSVKSIHKMDNKQPYNTEHTQAK